MPDLPQTKDWTVKAVREGKVEDNPKGGQLQKFYVDFEGCPDTYWRRKLPATVEVGQSYFGTISEGDYGPMFKKESPSDHRGSTATAGSANHSWKSGGNDPETIARIGRAHAQEMAVRTLTAMGTFESKHGMAIHNTLRSWTDWFADDVDQAGERASAASPVQGAGPSPTPPEQSPVPDDREYIAGLLETAALPPVAAMALAGVVLAEFNPGQVESVKKQLENFDTQASAVTKLKSFYEKSQGEPVPTVDAGDDIPF